jgi:sec-independent protein translocase protein TatA
MFQKFGVWEIVLILVIILIVFGVGKLPQVGSAIGKGIRSFKRGQSGEDEKEVEEVEEEKPARKRVVRSKAKKKTTKKKAATKEAA